MNEYPIGSEVGVVAESVPDQDVSMAKLAIGVFSAGSDVPIQAQTVIALRAFGMSPSEIAKRLGYKDPSSVRKLLYRYDPNKVAERGDAIRRLVLSAMFEHIALEVLTSVKPEEIRELPIDKRLSLATQAVKAIQSLSAKTVELSKNEESLIKELQGDFEEGSN